MGKSDKPKPSDSTKPDKTEQNNPVDCKTGLTPLQERAAYLLARGTSITEVATELDVSRNTIYSWQERPFFVAYYNKLRMEVRERMNNGLLSLADSAIYALYSILRGTNENLKLKASDLVIKAIQGQEIGFTTPKASMIDILEKDIYWHLHTYEFQEEVIRKALKEQGLE